MARKTKTFFLGENAGNALYWQVPNPEVRVWAPAAVFKKRKEQLRGLCGGMAGQLERACAGAASNTCAGAAAKGEEARRHFKIALSEAGEAGGCAKIAWRLGAFSDAEHAQLRALLLRTCACLRGLTR